MAPADDSSTPQARKIGLKSGDRLSLDHPPRGWRLIDRPPGIKPVRAPDAADVIISFFRAAEALPERLPDLAERIFPAGMLWVAWPRRATGHMSDITDNVVRAHALPLGLVDVKVAALDDNWSGLRLVWRRQLRSVPATVVNLTSQTMRRCVRYGPAHATGTTGHDHHLACQQFGHGFTSSNAR